MKFFINLISVIIQLNFSQSYQNTESFIIFTRNQNINLADEEWLTVLFDMDKEGRKNICNSVIETQFILSEEVDVDITTALIYRDRLIERKETEGIKAAPYKIEGLLVCVKCLIRGYSFLFFVMSNRKHETYILWKGSNYLRMESVLTKSYAYQQSSEEIREQIWQSLEAIPSKENLEADLKLPLYSLNDFNQRKLCATIINIPLPEIIEISLENKQNFMLFPRFVEKKFSYLDFPVASLECSFQDYLLKFTTFYIAQVFNHENHVIILGANAADMYDILEFEAGSSSSG